MTDATNTEDLQDLIVALIQVLDMALVEDDRCNSVKIAKQLHISISHMQEAKIALLQAIVESKKVEARS
jgi:hypothetical protein